MYCFLRYVLECIVLTGMYCMFLPASFDFKLSGSKYIPILSNTFDHNNTNSGYYESIHDVFTQYYTELRLDCIEPQTVYLLVFVSIDLFINTHLPFGCACSPAFDPTVFSHAIHVSGASFSSQERGHQKCPVHFCS